MNYYIELKENWINQLKNRKFRYYFSAVVFFLITLLIIFPRFLLFIESRQGVMFTDPVSGFLPPVDLTWLIFTLIYCSLIFGLIQLAKQPEYFLIAVNSYSILLITRMAAMYLLPLEPPAAMIALNDPFVETFGSGQLLTKDLFFSGHTATIFLLYLNSKTKLGRCILLSSSILVATSVLFQHVHYSIDVFAAPFFAYISYVFSKRIGKSLSLKKKLRLFLFLCVYDINNMY